MDRQVYKCECGYVTHFEKALEAHCRFRHHQPAGEETILPEVTEEVKKAVKRAAKAKKAEADNKEEKTRRPRAKKTAAKEQK